MSVEKQGLPAFRAPSRLSKLILVLRYYLRQARRRVTRAAGRPRQRRSARAGGR
jgi:hypothetical protein